MAHEDASQRQRTSTSPIRTILNTVSGFIAGAVIATVAQFGLSEIIKDPLSIPLPFVFYGLLVLIFVCLLVITVIVTQWAGYTQELRARVGVKTRYVELGSQQSDQDRVYSAARDIVEKAKKTIRVVQSYTTEYPERRESVNVDRTGYFAALLNHATHKVKYERIIQVRHTLPLLDIPHILKEEMRDSSTVTIEHIDQLLTERDLNNHTDTIGVFIAPAKRPITFVLVDSIYIIWQVNELTNSGQVRMHGVFIIEDRAQEIVPNFEAFYDALLHDSLALHRADLNLVKQELLVRLNATQP